MNGQQQYTYLSQYPSTLIAQVRPLIEQNRLGEMLIKRYPSAHDIRNNGALYTYVMEIKKEFMRQSAPVGKVRYDDRLSALHNALGQHRFVSKVQGSRLKTKSEVIIAGVFKKSPLAFLRMIVVHELAHLREKDHNKAFYQLCSHMQPDYHQIEFDMRLFLTHQHTNGPLYD